MMRDQSYVENSELSSELQFHGVDYIIQVSVLQGSILSVDVEQKEDGERWHGEFSKSYVEEVTSKTGNFKKFGVFVKMLATALRQSSDTVFADLLTYQDLEMLRSRQTRKPAATQTKPNNKRYLILTYAVEFDRVHYPLPLAHVDEPPAHALLNTIKRLRAEVAELKEGGGGPSVNLAQQAEVAELRSVNAELRAQLKKAESNRTFSAPNEEFDAMARERDSAVKEADRLRVEVSQLSRSNDKLAAELERHENNGAGFEKENQARQLKESRRRITELENELANEREEARHEQAELRRQLVVLQKQVDAGNQTITDLRIRIRELGGEVDSARRRARVEADPRLDNKRQIYTAGGSRPSSAERRRPTPPPARPFQRFDPTAYVKNKLASQRTRSISPRPGAPGASSARGTTSASSSRPSSAERQRPGAGPTSTRSISEQRARPSSGSRPSSTERQRPLSGSSARSISADRQRPSAVERSRPWAEGPRQGSPAERTRPWAEPPASKYGSRGGSRPSSSERQRPISAERRMETKDVGRPSSRERSRPWAEPPLSAAQHRSVRDRVYDSKSSVANRNTGAIQSMRSRPPSSPRTALGVRGQSSVESSPNAGKYSSSSRRRQFPIDDSSEGEENMYPRQYDNASSAKESGDEISDIDARLNALQSFLQAAKEKAKSTNYRSTRA